MEAKLSDSYLESRGVKGRSKCILVQKWTELLNPRTIATYRVRHLNAHGALREIDGLIDLVRDGIVGHPHLRPVREECIDLLCRDVSISAHQCRHRGQLLRNLGLLRSEERSSQLRLKYQLSHGLPEITRAYLVWLLADLRSALERNDSAAVGHLASALATELLSVGWSQRALYEMRDLLVEVLASEAGWSDFESMLTTPRRRYECAFLIDSDLTPYEESALIRLGLSVRRQVELLATPPYEDAARKAPIARRYLVTEVQAFDQFSALEHAEVKLSSALDMLKLFRFSAVELHSMRVVACLDTPMVTCLPADSRWMQLPLAFRSVAFETIARCMNHSALSRVDRSRFAAALSYYRMGIESIEPASKFISLWAALESFCRTPAYDSIVECVTCRIPELLTTGYLYRLTRNYYEDCRRTGVESLDSIIPVEANASGRSAVGETLAALCDPSRQGALRQATAFHSLLSERTEEITLLLSDSALAAKSFSARRQRLHWHLQRLYRVRNSIVHTGSTDISLSALTAHLQDYVEATLTHVAAIIASEKTTGIDADYALQSRSEVDPRIPTVRWKKSGFDSFLQNLSGSVANKGLASRYTTSMYSLEQMLQEAIALEPTDDPSKEDADAAEVEKNLRSSRAAVTHGFIEVAHEIEKHLDAEISALIDAELTPRIQEIDAQLDEIRGREQDRNKSVDDMQDLLQRTRSLVNDLHLAEEFSSVSAEGD